MRYVRTVASSSRVALVRTDAGLAYLKAINNPQGPHTLACDWLGTVLARRFGLQTFEISVLELTDLDEIPLDESTFAEPGPAFVAKAEDGTTMGDREALIGVVNTDDILRLVVFDTWGRNCDRYAPGLGRNGPARMNLDNLFLSTEGAPEAGFILKAIDHGHILTCGKPIDRSLANIDNTHDERLYGLFPFFRGYVSVEGIDEAADLLRKAGPDLWGDILGSIPAEWGLSNEARQAIDGFLLERARFLIDNLHRIVYSEPNPSNPDSG
jgi:hypothetical protein